MMIPLMTVRTHSHRLTIEQVKAQPAKARRQLVEVIEMATKPVAEEVTEAGESSMAAEESQTKKAIVDVAMGVIDEERSVVASKAITEPTTPGVDIALAESQEEMPPITTEHEAVMEIAPPIDAPSTQVDEAEPFGTVASRVTEAISEIVQTPSGEPRDIASFIATILELLTLGSADTPELRMIPILSMIVPQLGAEVVNEYIAIGLVTGPHAMIIKALLTQLFTFMKNVVPLLLQGVVASEGTIARLEGLAGSIRCFDAPLADRLKTVIDRL